MDGTTITRSHSVGERTEVSEFVIVTKNMLRVFQQWHSVQA